MSIAVLGAGILGSCTALELADRGHRVSLFERNAEPVREASLYNEGKIHLGFVYAADPSFRTAARMIDGAARFMDLLGRWVPSAVLRTSQARPFDYVVHKDTMVPIDRLEAHYARVATRLEEALPRGVPAVPYDPSRAPWRRLTPAELASRYDPASVVAAYETHEIAVDTWTIAEQLRAALRAHPRIELVTRARVLSADERSGGDLDVSYEADGARRAGPFHAVVNALWANRRAVDRRSGLPQTGSWLVRRKLGVNLVGLRPSDIPSATIVLGPFGDIVSYPSGRVYLSWYPTCMIGTATGDEETDWQAVARAVDADAIRRETIAALAAICPLLETLGEATAQAVVDGGSIFAAGETDIDDPQSRLHERLDAGPEGRARYVSVDTSKYSLGPAIALTAADRVEALLKEGR